MSSDSDTTTTTKVRRKGRVEIVEESRCVMDDAGIDSRTRTGNRRAGQIAKRHWLHKDEEHTCHRFEWYQEHTGDTRGNATNSRLTIKPPGKEEHGLERVVRMRAWLKRHHPGHPDYVPRSPRW